MHADHPRACGANDFLIAGANVGCGSSPRVRGKPGSASRPVVTGRIIPARAGQTVALLSAANAPPDHPRACGANPPRMASANRGGGSSPRVRGKLHRFPLRSFRVRIIPARAGQTAHGRRQARGDTDHPRACGANWNCSRKSANCVGSSPRVRGKRSPGTPPTPERADHPRACGANCRHHLAAGIQTGSSPRVRGKPWVARCGRAGKRIIPARAGQTASSSAMLNSFSDHPRACRANLGEVECFHYASGSSPRVRGKLTPSSLVIVCLRIIPARAGQTAIGECPAVARTDHPRACGANW